MADTQVQNLSAITTATSDDVIYIVDDPTGTPASKKITISNLFTSPTLVTPVLGIPSSGTLTSCTGLPLTTGVTGTLPVANGGTGVTTSTGSGALVFGTSPTLTTPVLGTPASGTLTNCSGYTETFIVACSDETTLLTAAVDKVKFRMPYAFTVTAVRGSLSTVATGATLLTVDINESGTTILSTKLTFDASESTTTTAATPAVISDTALANDAEITVDIDAIGSTTAGKGLKVYIIGYRT